MVNATAFTASRATTDRISRITLAGELDLATAPTLRSEFENAVGSQPHTVVLDLSGLTFMDCAALRALMDFADRAGAGGWELRIERPPPRVSRIFALTGTAAMLPLGASDDRLDAHGLGEGDGFVPLRIGA